MEAKQSKHIHDSTTIVLIPCLSKLSAHSYPVAVLMLGTLGTPSTHTQWTLKTNTSVSLTCDCWFTPLQTFLLRFFHFLATVVWHATAAWSRETETSPWWFPISITWRLRYSRPVLIHIWQRSRQKQPKRSLVHKHEAQINRVNAIDKHRWTGVTRQGSLIISNHIICSACERKRVIAPLKQSQIYI